MLHDRSLEFEGPHMTIAGTTLLTVLTHAGQISMEC